MPPDEPTVRDFLKSREGKIVALWTGWQIGEDPHYFARVLATGDDQFRAVIFRPSTTPGLAKAKFRVGKKEFPFDEAGERLIPYRSVRALVDAEVAAAEAKPGAGSWR